MSKVIKLNKGLDIKLNGEAEKTVKTGVKCMHYAVKPTDFFTLNPPIGSKGRRRSQSGRCFILR